VGGPAIAFSRLPFLNAWMNEIFDRWRGADKKEVAVS
jgi:hypothetical protein